MTNYNFTGVQNAEQQDRMDEVRCGAPRFGAQLALLLFAPAARTEGVHLMNAADHAVETWLRHAGTEKTVTGARLEGLGAAGQTSLVGNLQHKGIVPRTAAGTKGITITDSTGSPQVLVDDGEGNLLVQGTTTVVGTIDYANGRVDATLPGNIVYPISADYVHTDYTDFVSPQQAIPSTPTAAFSFSFSLPFGRVVAGSVAFTDGALTFVDDGRGLIIETTAAGEAVRGSIDYATGVVTMDSSSAALGGNFTGTFNFNPFAARIAGGGAAKLLDIYGNGIPELTSEPFADGIKGESFIGLVGKAAEAALPGSNQGGFLITQWAHFGEDPYRVEEGFTSFPPGGAVAVAGNANA